MRKSILAAAAALSGLALAGMATAQTAQPDAAKMALARQVIAAAGGSKGVEAQMRSIYGAIGAGMSQAGSPDQAKLNQQIMTDMQEEMAKLIPSIVDVSAKAYADNLTEQQLKDTLAYYRSDSGRAVIDKLPTIMLQSMRAEMPMIQAMVPQVMQKALDHACDQQKCTPEVRQQAAAVMAKALQRPGS